MRQKMNPIATDDGRFKDGNPATGEYGTVVTAEHMNNVQDAVRTTQGEILTVLREAGIEPSADDETQLWQALQVMAGQVESIEALRQFEPVRERQIAYLKGYYAGSNVGGGYFIADLEGKNITDDKDKVIVTVNGNCWKRIDYFYSNARNLTNSIGKRRILHNLPIEFSDYNEVLAIIGNNDNWMYPQGFAISNNIIYIYYITQKSARACVACFDFTSGNYLGYYIVPDNVVTTREGLVVKDGRIYVGVGDFINAYAIGNYNTTLQLISSHKVNPNWQFTYSGNAWLVEQTVQGKMPRNKLAIFNNDFELQGYKTLPLDVSGYVSRNSQYVKRQGIAAKGDYILCSFGALFEQEKTQKANNHNNGVALVVGDSVIARASYDPTKLIQKLNTLGFSSTRVENEGCVITDDNRMITLTCIGGDGGGLLIAEEFSEHPLAIDFGDCLSSLSSTGNNDIIVYSKDGTFINPINGKPLSDLADVCNYMRDADKSMLRLNIPKGKNLKINESLTIPQYSFVDLTATEYGDFWIELKSTKDLPSAFIFRPATKELVFKGEIQSGHTHHWRTDEGASEAFKRMYSVSPDGKEFLYIDIQHTSSGNKLFLGGSAAGAYAFDQIAFGTNKGSSADKGYYIHWLINNAGAFLPNANNAVEIGASNKKVKAIYVNTPSLDDSSALVPTTEWVHSRLNTEKLLWSGSSTTPVSVTLSKTSGIVAVLSNQRGFDVWDYIPLENCNNTYIGKTEFGGENADRQYHTLIKVSLSGSTLTLNQEGHHTATIKKVISLGG